MNTPKFNTKLIFEPCSDTAFDYVCLLYRGYYGICCPLTVTLNMCGHNEPLCCDGHPHGMHN